MPLDHAQHGGEDSGAIGVCELSSRKGNGIGPLSPWLVETAASRIGATARRHSYPRRWLGARQKVRNVFDVGSRSQPIAKKVDPGVNAAQMILVFLGRKLWPLRRTPCQPGWLICSVDQACELQRNASIELQRITSHSLQRLTLVATGGQDDQRWSGRLGCGNGAVQGAGWLARLTWSTGDLGSLFQRHPAPEFRLA